MIYFNENDAYPAAWLRNLYPEAVVDDRSIIDVKPEDLAGYTRCHFFGGIGAWDYALELAGWPAAAPVWTGSCPCQPFSSAGRQLGGRDKRHLWPVWLELIRVCRPPTIFGEQVASRAGREWLAGVRADLEALGYVVGAADLCAAGAGSPHIRQRLYWVAYDDGSGRGGLWRAGLSADGDASRGDDPDRRGSSVRLANTAGGRRNWRPPDEGRSEEGRAASAGTGETCGVADPVLAGPQGLERERGVLPLEGDRPGRAGEARGLADGVGQRDADGRSGSAGAAPSGVQRANGQREWVRPDPWERCDALYCRDGKYRRTEPGLFPLADGVPFRLADGRTREGASRVQALRGIGNAIVPPVAAQFISACMDVLGVSV